MKTFKNIVAIAALFVIGSMHTKQTGAKKTAQPIIPQPTRPVIQQPTTKPSTTQQPSRVIPQESPKSSSFDTQYFVKKINDLDFIATETYKMIEEHFANMQLENQIIILDATKIMFHNLGNQIEKVTDMYREQKKSSEKKPNINQPYMVTEKNKQLMENNLKIEAQIAFKRIIDDSLQYDMDLGNNDMRHICEKIDSLLRKANIDYTQLGSTNEEQIAHAKMAMDIAEKAIIEQLSQFKASNLRKLANYILESNYDNDPRIKNIRRNLSK